MWVSPLRKQGHLQVRTSSECQMRARLSDGSPGIRLLVRLHAEQPVVAEVFGIQNEHSIIRFLYKRRHQGDQFPS